MKEFTILTQDEIDRRAMRWGMMQCLVITKTVGLMFDDVVPNLNLPEDQRPAVDEILDLMTRHFANIIDTYARVADASLDYSALTVEDFKVGDRIGVEHTNQSGRITDRDRGIYMVVFDDNPDAGIAWPFARHELRRSGEPTPW